MPITNAPNNVSPGNRANGSFAQPRSASPVNPPNTGAGGDRRMGSYPLSGSGSPINPPNAGLTFSTSDAEAQHNKTANAPAAVQPGKGAVPVNPGIGGTIRMPYE